MFDVCCRQMREWEAQICADIRGFLANRSDEKFSGRSVARIFHGIGAFLLNISPPSHVFSCRIEIHPCFISSCRKSLLSSSNIRP